MDEKQILEKIQKAANAGDLEQIEKLTPVARQLRSLSEQESAIARERETILARLNGSQLQEAERPRGRVSGVVWGKTYRRGNMFVEIRLPGRSPVRIAEPTAADTLRATLEHLAKALGSEKLEPLTRFRISRGPLLSRNPRADFRNSKTGALYAYHPVADTGLFVLTHSSTSEKIANLREALHRLGFSSSDFEVGRS